MGDTEQTGAIDAEQTGAVDRKKTTFETIEELLKSTQDEIDDPDLTFKLRTARQLVLVLQERQEAGRQALENADLDPSVREDLRNLGYME